MYIIYRSDPLQWKDGLLNLKAHTHTEHKLFTTVFEFFSMCFRSYHLLICVSLHAAQSLYHCTPAIQNNWQQAHSPFWPVTIKCDFGQRHWNQLIGCWMIMHHNVIVFSLIWLTESNQLSAFPCLSSFLSSPFLPSHHFPGLSLYSFRERVMMMAAMIPAVNCPTLTSDDRPV